VELDVALDAPHDLRVTNVIVLRGRDPRIHHFFQKDGLPDQVRQ
jgi:hypothetical protein